MTDEYIFYGHIPKECMSCVRFSWSGMCMKAHNELIGSIPYVQYSTGTRAQDRTVDVVEQQYNYVCALKRL